MARQWSDPMVMALLSLLSVGAVVGVNQLLKNRLPDSALPRQKELAEEVKMLSKNFENDRRTTARQISDLQSTLRDLQKKLEITARTQTQPVKPQPPPTVDPTTDAKNSGPSGFVEEALDRGRQYIATNKFNSRDHDRLLSDLIVAYRIRGLSPSENRSLLATIQQINELGLSEVIRAAQTLNQPEATEKLQQFLKNTPELTPGQIDQLRSALARIQRRRNNP